VRELEEEAGYSAGRVEELGSFLTTPGITDERMHAFVAWDLERVGQRLEVDEAIEVEVVSASDALAMATDGRMVDGKSMLTVLWAARAGYLDGSSAGGS
jgi:ADP-ribose pyrophosphatase